jgi:isoprenylcysteine carboxyl methyltransferase (ICMT) family protein YpbQ
MPHPEMRIASTALSAVLIMMLAEFTRSRRHERELRRLGAVEADRDVYRAMAFVYPMIFIVMAGEGALFGRAAGWVLTAGVTIFIAAKLLKLWAIRALGLRWSYRVLVLPGTPLVTTGPYAHLRHPNYVAVFGEIAGFAMTVGAAWTGIGSLLLFGLLVRRRIAVEENALETAQGSGLQAAPTAQDSRRQRPGARRPEPGA